MDKKLLQAIENGREDIFYNSRTWRKKRLEILERDKYECQMCKELGRVGKGETVHHIKHLKDRPDLGLADSNLITVCYAHHNELHPEKQRQGKAKGKDKDKFVNEERW